jgi:phage head maturation protease
MNCAVPAAGPVTGTIHNRVQERHEKYEKKKNGSCFSWTVLLVYSLLEISLRVAPLYSSSIAACAKATSPSASS